MMMGRKWNSDELKVRIKIGLTVWGSSMVTSRTIAILPRKSNNLYTEELFVIPSLFTIPMIQKQPRYLWHKEGGSLGSDGQLA